MPEGREAIPWSVMALSNPQAKRGYSRDKRPDCPQVCIGLVTSKGGLPLAFEVFDGNRADVTEEVFVLCRSEGRQEKEMAILNRLVARLEAGLNKLKEQAEQGRLRDRQKANRRIGQLLERNSRAASLFDVAVTETARGKDKQSACRNI